jgi:drug/metabolite transporter (DMT)-like permease
LKAAAMNQGIAFALASALLFGISTPLAKALVATISPLLLAGVLYAGSGFGLALVVAIRRVSSRGSLPILPRVEEWRSLVAAIFFGGVFGPAALMYGLVTSAASTASLLLNLEAVFTALLAWFLFNENFDRRIALGMAAIVGGGALLAWAPGRHAGASLGAWLVVAACF